MAKLNDSKNPLIIEVNRIKAERQEKQAALDLALKPLEKARADMLEFGPDSENYKVWLQKRVDGVIEKRMTGDTSLLDEAEAAIAEANELPALVAGLDQRHDAIATTVRTVDHQMKLAVSALLRARAEELGAVYVDHGEKLVDALGKIQAIARVLERSEYAMNHIGSPSLRCGVSIPLFALDCHAGKSNGDIYKMGAAQDLAGNTEVAIAHYDDLLASLVEVGIEI